MTFPAWTPQWVVEEFRADFSNPDDLRDWPFGDIECRDWLIAIVRSPESRIVWDALSKHSERPQRLAELATFIWAAHWGFGHAAVKRSQRLKIAKEARRHAEAFSRSLAGLTEQDYFAMNSIVGSFVELSVRGEITAEIEAFHSIYNDDPASPHFVPIDVLQRARAAIEQVAKNVVLDALWGRRDYHLLGGVCGSLDKWAAAEQTVTKPDHPNAKRLYFLRSLTDSFVQQYGRPMRKETLALTSVFFDTTGLDEAAISRLAPVQTRCP